MLWINLISLYLLIVSVGVVFCTAQIRSFNGARYTRTALLLCYAVCFYILGYTMELNAVTRVGILFWNRVEYVGIPFVSALWLTTVLMYTGYFARFKRILIPAVFGIPAGTLILRLTNEYHHLYFTSEQYAQALGTLLFVKQPGPWMRVQSIHSASMILLSMAFLIYHSVRHEGKQIGKILLITGASIFSVTGLFLTQQRPFNIPIDYMALCLPVTCIMVILAILRYDLLETRFIARSKAFDAGGDAIFLVNRQKMVLDYNNSARRLMGQLGIHLSNRPLWLLFEERPELLHALEKTESSVVKLRLNDKDGFYEITTENIDDRNSLRGWIKTIRDITEIYQLNKELKRQAMTDELSGLINRRAFIDVGSDWVSRSEKSGAALHLLMMDLDHFKDVNDRYGHPTGDVVIRDFSQMLKSHFNSNSVVARLGGEEFAVLLQNVDDDEAIRDLEAFRKTAGAHVYCHLDNQFYVTVSTGMTRRQPGQLLESVMGQADRALYRSKDRGRNRSTVL